MNDTETSAAWLKPFPQRSTEQMPSVPLIPLSPCRVLSYCSFPLRISRPSKAEKRGGKNKNKPSPHAPLPKKKEYLQMENGTIMPILMEKLPNIATKTCRKFLRSVYCKPQAAFLGCVLTGPGPTRSWSKWFLISTIQHHTLSYYILCYSCIMLLVSSHISNSVAGSRSIWKKDTGSMEAGFSHLL